MNNCSAKNDAQNFESFRFQIFKFPRNNRRKYTPRPGIPAHRNVTIRSFSVMMDCIVSVHYRDSDFELDQCDIHRKKRQSADNNEKELEYKIELVVKDQDSKNQPGDQNSSAVKYSIFWFIFIFIFQ